VGATLGYPTANVKPGHHVVPPHGVYMAEAIVGRHVHPAAVNIGIAPTIRHDDIVIEAFILDFSGNIMGKEIEVVFVERLRPEMKFPTREALVKQIDEDVRYIRRNFGLCR
jgi:riboflavin kinase/FMN adenylyltransferase